MRGVWVWAGLAWPMLWIALNVSAQAPAAAVKKAAAKQRLTGLSRGELSLLSPLLKNGPAALVEFTERGTDELPAVNVAVRVAASANLVARLLADPPGYPRFLKTVDTITVVGNHGQSMAYEWGWGLAVFTLKGRNVLDAYPPRGPKGRESYRLTVRSESGDMGKGRSLFRVWPEPNGGALLVISMRQDLRDANYITRKLAGASRSINRTANLSLSFSLAMGIKREAERLAGTGAAGGGTPSQHAPGAPSQGQPTRGTRTRPANKTQRPTAPRNAKQSLRRPELQREAYWPLLLRGDLIWLDAGDREVRQVAVLGRVHANAQDIREVVMDADSFGRALIPGSHAHVTQRKPGLMQFEWGIRLPLIGVSGSMRMRERPEAITVEAISGAFEGGRWRFATYPHAPGVTITLGWASFDLSEANWLMDRLIQADPHLRHGLSAASQVMLVRALRARLRTKGKRVKRSPQAMRAAQAQADFPD